MAANTVPPAAVSAGAAASFRPGAPNVFLCPISQEVMAEPVVAADGHSYEKTEIEKWFASLSPSLSLPPSLSLTPRAVSQVRHGQADLAHDQQRDGEPVPDG